MWFIDRESNFKENLQEAYSKGRKAHVFGKTWIDNPYKKQTEEHLIWNYGFNNSMKLSEIKEADNIFKFKSPKCSG